VAKPVPIPDPLAESVAAPHLVQRRGVETTNDAQRNAAQSIAREIMRELLVSDNRALSAAMHLHAVIRAAELGSLTVEPGKLRSLVETVMVLSLN